MGTRGGGKINLEAYEAYHNSKENALLLSHTQSEELVTKDQGAPASANTKKIKATDAAGGEEKKQQNQAQQKQKAFGKEGETKGEGDSPATTTNNYTTVM